jgi:hypothetical protein
MKYVTAVTAILALSAQACAASSLLPHRAVYEMSVVNIDKKSGILSGTGLLAYEITGSTCDGWITNYRIATRYERTEAGEQLNDFQVNGWEAGDGTAFQMEEKQYVDQRLTSRRNVLAKKLPDAEGFGQLTRPQERTFKIPKEAVFPIRHQLRLLKAAAAGEKRNVSVVFEGAEDEKSLSAVALIGNLRDPKTMDLAVNEKSAAELRREQAWSIAVSYYPVEPNRADAPDYQTSFTMFSSGVSTDLLFDYGSFALRGKLTKLEFLPEQDCPQD